MSGLVYWILIFVKKTSADINGGLLKTLGNQPLKISIKVLSVGCLGTLSRFLVPMGEKIGTRKGFFENRFVTIWWRLLRKMLHVYFYKRTWIFSINDIFLAWERTRDLPHYLIHKNSLVNLILQSLECIHSTLFNKTPFH